MSPWKDTEFKAHSDLSSIYSASKRNGVDYLEQGMALGFSIEKILFCPNNGFVVTTPIFNIIFSKLFHLWDF